MQSNLDQLQARMTHLEHEVRSLRSQRGMICGFLLALAIVSAAIAGTAPTTKPPSPQPQDLVCNSLKVMNKDKTLPMVTLDADADGGVVTVAGADGKSRVSIAVDQDGGGLELAGNDRRPRVTLGADRQGGLAVFFDGKGAFKARLP